MRLYNTLTRKKEEFIPINPPKVGMYTCGMTVYDYAHIGHGRKYVMDDVLRRVLATNGYEVLHVQNVTDVGHLVSDADEGEDKMEKGAKKTGKTVWEIADYFTNHFYSSMDKLNILRPDIISRATEHIEDQINLVKKLVEKGFAYDTPEAVYFDISKFPSYGELSGQKLTEKMVAVRKEVKMGEYKKSPRDFALWFKRVGRFENHTMHWDSPWGDGFPGWHIECSAMSMKDLGETIDIHTGGVDHIPVHHTNEIAQSEAATGRQFVKYWIHYEFLMVDGRKMSKSLGNLFTIEDVEKKGFDPVSLRYLYLTSHYRDPLNFTWESLSGAQNALDKIKAQVSSLKSGQRTVLSQEKNEKVEKFKVDFREAINDDLNTSKGLAVLWEMIKSNIPSEDKYDLAMNFDEVLGLNLGQNPTTQSVTLAKIQIPNEIQKLVDKREKLRKEGKFNEADEVRREVEKLGYKIEDMDEGPKIVRRSLKDQPLK